MPVPNEWYDNTMINEQKKPEFVQQAIYGIIPKKPDNIPADYRTEFNWTIPMILSYNKINNIP